MNVSIARSIAKIGQILMIIGGIALASIFLIVLINGSWPDYLQPIRSRFEIGSKFLGDFWFPALIGIFIGPGMAVTWFGEKLNRAR